MPEISLLNPTVLNGVVERFTTPEEMVALTSIFNDREPSPDPTAKWDVIEGNREIAKPNVPNSEAHIVPQLGVAQRTAAFLYLREKKVFSPTTIRWLRMPGSLAAKNAEAKVLREVRDLDRRFDAYAEYVCWQALTGTLSVDEADVKATIDYGFDASHKPTPSTTWDDSGKTVADWLADLQAWKRLIQLDGRVPAEDIWLNGTTWNAVVQLLADNPELLSDRMKDQVMADGVTKGLAGLTWHVIDHQYVDDAGSEQMYVADGDAIITSSRNRPFYLMEGPSADEDAPDGHIGKFVKSWKAPDPSARQHLEEWHFLPIIERPEQVVYASSLLT